MRIHCTFSTISEAENAIYEIQSALAGIDRLDMRDLASLEFSGVVRLPGEAFSQKAVGGGASVSFYCPDQHTQEAIHYLKASGARKINLRG